MQVPCPRAPLRGLEPRVHRRVAVGLRQAGRARIAAAAEGSSSTDEGGSALAAAFSKFVNLSGISPPAAATAASGSITPSPLIPPTVVVSKLLEALQRNDWPEQDSGVTSAYAFTLRASEGPDAGSAVRSWRAQEEWLTWPRFHAQLHTAYGPLLNCDSWKVVSPLLFPSSRHENRAVQAVEVRGAPRSALRAPSGSDGGGGQTSSGGSHGHGYGGAAGGGLRSYTFTFCLERVLEGPLKDCWMVAGCRTGNYAIE